MYLSHISAAFGFLRQFTQSPGGLLHFPLEIEYDEATGKIGTLPEPVQKFVDRLVDQSHAKLRTQISDLEKKISSGGGDAAERERLKALEEENQRYKTSEAERQADYNKALKIREEADAKREEERKKDGEKTAAELKRRDDRLRDMARSEIKIAARTHGARTESLDELARLLGADLDLDADLQPFVKGPDGKPLLGADQKPVSIEGHVKAYLDTHSHHRASSGGTGGGARGGASFTGADPTEVEKAEKALDEAQKKYRKGRNPRDLAAIQSAQNHLNDVKAGKTTK